MEKFSAIPPTYPNEISQFLANYRILMAKKMLGPVYEWVCISKRLSSSAICQIIREHHPLVPQI